MSYCRWSSDDWKCDLYCYEYVHGGYLTHVADRRLISILPTSPKIEDGNFDEFFRIHREQMKILETAEYEDIDLPYAGETFNDPNLPSFLDRVTSLKELGYHVPDYVIEMIQEEIKENDPCSP